MYPLICHVDMCGRILDTAPEREAHAREMHGFPPTDNGLNGLRSSPYQFAEDPRIFQNQM